MLNGFVRNERRYPMLSLSKNTKKDNVIHMKPFEESSCNTPNTPMLHENWETLDDNYANTPTPTSQKLISSADLHPLYTKRNNEQEKGSCRRANETNNNITDDQNDWGGLAKIEPVEAKRYTEVDNSDVNELIYGSGYRNGGKEHTDKPFEVEDIVKVETIDPINTDLPNTNSSEIVSEFYDSLFGREHKSGFNWFIPNLLAIGPHPFYYSGHEDLEYLKHHGIKAIVSVFEEPIPDEWLAGFDYYFAPTLDNYSSHLLEICEFIENMEKQDKPVFIHCFGGLGRSSTVVAAYMIYKHYLTAEQAIQYVRDKYDKKAIETKYQEHDLFNLEARISNDSKVPNK